MGPRLRRVRPNRRFRRALATRDPGSALARAGVATRSRRVAQRHLPRARSADLLGARRRRERLGRRRQPLRRSRRRLRRRQRGARAPARRRGASRAGRATAARDGRRAPVRREGRTARALAALFPGGVAARAVLGSSGSDAVEIALKTAQLATGRAGVVAFEGAYHGLSLGALDATWRPASASPSPTRLPGATSFARFGDVEDVAPRRRDVARPDRRRAGRADPGPRRRAHPAATASSPHCARSAIARAGC